MLLDPKITAETTGVCSFAARPLIIITGKTTNTMGAFVASLLRNQLKLQAAMIGPEQVRVSG